MYNSCEIRVKPKPKIQADRYILYKITYDSNSDSLECKNVSQIFLKMLTDDCRK